MTTLDAPSPKVARESHIDLAGTAWPLYKLEAVAVGFVLLLMLFVVPGAAQIAVLTAAAAATVVWWARRIYYLRG